MFPTENEPERSYLLPMSQNILPSLFNLHGIVAMKNFFSQWINALFLLLLLYFLLFPCSCFTGLLPFSVALLLYNLTKIAPSSLQFNQQGLARWVGRELGTINDKNVFQLASGLGSSDSKKDVTEWYFYTFKVFGFL